MAHLLVDEAKYSTLDQILQQLPNTDLIRGVLGFAIENRRLAKCYVDNFPDVCTICIILEKAVHLADGVCTVYTTKITKCKKFLVDLKDELHWTVLFTVPSDIADILKEMAPVDVMFDTPTTMYSGTSEDNTSINLLHKEMRLDKLYKRDVELVVKTSAPKDAVPDYETHIEWLLENCICSAVRIGKDDKDTLIGWIFERAMGCQGHLYVVEDYRGKGIAQYLIQEHSRLLRKANRPVYAMIEEANEASHALFRKCGYTECGKITFMSAVYLRRMLGGCCECSA